MDDWAIYGLEKYHTANLRLMLEQCRQLKISLNLKKCIFCVPFKILLGHIICKEVMLVDPSNTVVNIDLPTPTILKQIREKLGYARYYWKFIRGYTIIMTLIEKLLKKDVKLKFNDAF